MSYQQNRNSIQGASIEVRRDDVNGALRKLKKILEQDDRQKDLSKHEYHERPSVKKKRARDLARRRAQSATRTDIHHVMRQANPTGTKWMKSKRKRRKVLDAKTQFVRMTRNQ